MPSPWIILSTKWSLTSVQASLNVIISLLGTIGLWAFTRFWWRKGGIKVLRNKNGVPLSKLFTISGLGESWDVVVTLRRQIFAKENWNLLIQLIVVIGFTVACGLAGPIAKVSLRNGTTLMSKQLQVLQSVKGGGAFGNLLFAAILWNDTAQSLNEADFPADQLLDILPLPTRPPWTYIAAEWNPTWTASCNYTDQVQLHNVTGSGEYNIFDPVNSFPEFRKTYPPTWLDDSKYRMTSDYNSWQHWTQEKQFQDVLFYVLIQSDPEIDNRMLYNNETLEISLTVLHARDFQVLYEDTSGVRGESSWRPVGPVSYASYSRAECAIMRRPDIKNTEKVPWPWTNDTLSIMSGYRNYFNDAFAAAAVKQRTVKPPTSRDLFRFYQVYMATINTFHSDPSPKVLSVKMQTVELSVIFLSSLILLAVLSAWSSIRYAWFLNHNKKQLEDLYVPDGKIEWMIHAVKCSEMGIDLEANNTERRRKDSEHFCAATFGPVTTTSGPLDTQLTMPSLARVRSGRSSISGVSPNRKFSVSPARSYTTNLSSLDDSDRKSHNHSIGSDRSLYQSNSNSLPSPQTSERLRVPSHLPSIDVETSSKADDDEHQTHSAGLSPSSQHSSSTPPTKPLGICTIRHETNCNMRGCNIAHPPVSPIESPSANSQLNPSPNSSPTTI